VEFDSVSNSASKKKTYLHNEEIMFFNTSYSDSSIVFTSTFPRNGCIFIFYLFCIYFLVTIFIISKKKDRTSRTSVFQLSEKAIPSKIGDITNIFTFPINYPSLFIFFIVNMNNKIIIIRILPPFSSSSSLYLFSSRKGLSLWDCKDNSDYSVILLNFILFLLSFHFFFFYILLI
jgi:hypothetical protein